MGSYNAKMAIKMAIHCLIALVVTVTIFNVDYLPQITVGHYGGPSMLDSDNSSYDLQGKRVIENKINLEWQFSSVLMSVSHMNRLQKHNG